MSHTCASLFTSKSVTVTLSFWVQFQNVNNTEKLRLFSKKNAVKQNQHTEQQIITNQDTIKNNDYTTIAKC